MPISFVRCATSIRRHAVQTDRRKQQRDNAEQPGETRDRPLLIEREFHLLLASSVR